MSTVNQDLLAALKKTLNMVAGGHPSLDTVTAAREAIARAESEQADVRIHGVIAGAETSAPASVVGLKSGGWFLKFEDERDFCRFSSILIGAAYTSGVDSLKRFDGGSLRGERTYGKVTAYTQSITPLSPEKVRELRTVSLDNVGKRMGFTTADWDVEFARLLMEELMKGAQS